jgi:hypothetical protein
MIKRVVVGRKAALRPRLCPCLAPASNNQVQPSSGCRQGGDFTSNLATAQRLSLSYPPSTHGPAAPTKRVVVGHAAALRRLLSPYLTPASKNQVQPSSGCRQGGAISAQISPLPSVSFSCPSPTQNPIAPTKRAVVGRTAALRLRLFPCLTPSSKNHVQPSSGCRQGGKFHLKPRLCPLALFPTRHPPNTPLLQQNESPPAARRRYRSVLSVPNIFNSRTEALLLRFVRA